MTDTAVATGTLEIRGLHASVEGKEILKGIDLVVKQGETHALMGPNGSGKSTLANVLMGRPGYKVTAGGGRFQGGDNPAPPPGPPAPPRPLLAPPDPVRGPRVLVVDLPPPRIQGGEAG